MGEKSMLLHLYRTLHCVIFSLFIISIVGYNFSFHTHFTKREESRCYVACVDICVVNDHQVFCQEFGFCFRLTWFLYVSILSYIFGWIFSVHLFGACVELDILWNTPKNYLRSQFTCFILGFTFVVVLCSKFRFSHCFYDWTIFHYISFLFRFIPVSIDRQHCVLIPERDLLLLYFVHFLLKYVAFGKISTCASISGTCRIFYSVHMVCTKPISSADI